MRTDVVVRIHCECVRVQATTRRRYVQEMWWWFESVWHWETQEVTTIYVAKENDIEEVVKSARMEEEKRWHVVLVFVRIISTFT